MFPLPLKGSDVRTLDVKVVFSLETSMTPLDQSLLTIANASVVFSKQLCDVRV